MSETQSAFGVGAATITQKVTATTGVGSFIGFIAKNRCNCMGWFGNCCTWFGCTALFRLGA